MKKELINHIFFDLDHTLWDFDKNSALAFAKIFDGNKLAINLEDFLKVYQPINFQYWKWFREGMVTKKQLRYGRFKKSFDALGIKVNDQYIDQLSEDYIKYLPDNNHLFEGTIEILNYLNPKYNMHIITNGFEEVQYTKLERSRISHFFDSVTTSEEAGVKKPHPLIFENAMQKVNAVPSNSLMIGDTYEADILGAHKVGMKSICFNYHKHELPKDQLVIDNLIQLKDIL